MTILCSRSIVPSRVLTKGLKHFIEDVAPSPNIYFGSRRIHSDSRHISSSQHIHLDSRDVRSSSSHSMKFQRNETFLQQQQQCRNCPNLARTLVHDVESAENTQLSMFNETFSNFVQYLVNDRKLGHLHHSMLAAKLNDFDLR